MQPSNTTTHNLLFLLAAAPLGMGCIIVSDDTDETTGATNNTSGNTTTGDTDTPTTSASGSATDSGGMTETGMESTGSMDSTGANDTTAGVGETCLDYAALYEECYPNYGSEYAESYCQYNLDYNAEYSEECGVLAEAFFACLSSLTCEDLSVVETRCPDELAAWLDICPSVE